MTFHVYLVDPRTGAPEDTPIENGVTHRPASWPTHEAASRYVADCKATRRWNHMRDPFDWGYLIKENGKEGSE